MKESQPFLRPFQWWRSHIPPLGPSPVAMTMPLVLLSLLLLLLGRWKGGDWSWWECGASFGPLVVRAGPLPLLDLLGDLGARGK